MGTNRSETGAHALDTRSRRHLQEPIVSASPYAMLPHVTDTLRQPGQLLFAGLPGLDVPDDLAGLIREGRVGGVTLFARNIGTPDETRRLTDALHALAPTDAPLCVAIDQEGGRVQRLRAPWTEFPPARALGVRDDVDATRAVGRAIGVELRDVGFDLDFAPCCDVDSNPDNPVIGDRSFATEADAVAWHAGAFIEGLQSAGVAACAKHFPGHGDTVVDSHLELPRVSTPIEHLRSVEWPPFHAARHAGVASMMTAHVVLEVLDPEHPATLSRAALDVLRQDIGYEGLVFTDDLEMKAVADHYSPTKITRLALEAGVDVLLVCSRDDLRDSILAALEASPPTRLAASLDRMARFKSRWVANGERSVAANTPPYPEHTALAETIG